MSKKNIHELVEGVDFYWDEISGVRLRVFTKDYLRTIRQFCCKTGCRHCPFDYKKPSKNEKNN